MKKNRKNTPRKQSGWHKERNFSALNPLTMQLVAFSCPFSVPPLVVVKLQCNDELGAFQPSGQRQSGNLEEDETVLLINQAPHANDPETSPTLGHMHLIDDGQMVYVSGDGSKRMKKFNSLDVVRGADGFALRGVVVCKRSKSVLEILNIQNKLIC